MGSYRVDTSDWPVNVWRLEGELEGRTVSLLVEELLAITTRGERHLNIWDMTRVTSGTAEGRRLFGEHQKENAAAYKKGLVGAVVVMRSRLVRGLLTAIQWIHPFPIETKFVESMAKAERLAQTWLQAEGIVWPGFTDQAQRTG